MRRPCPRCRHEIRPEQLDTGRRCGDCVVAGTDEAIGVLLAGLRVPRRRRWAA